MLFDVGQTVVPFFVITEGRVEIVRPAAAVETVITVHGPGEFTGEVNMLSGPPQRWCAAARSAPAR